MDLGCEVFDVPVDAFVAPDAADLSILLSRLRAFRPQLAFGLSLGGYALLCRLPPRRDGSRLNIFLDVLDIPAICLWDHAPLELADQMLAPHPANPAESRAGALEALQRIFTHPRLIHWSRDTGQTRVMRDLGFVRPNRVIQQVQSTLPGFDPPEPDAAQNGVSFVGHFYQEKSTDPNGLAEQTSQSWVEAFDRPLWDVLADQIAELSEDARKQLALDRDQTYFWTFAHRLIVHRAQTALRLKLLGAASVPVLCYGNLNADQPGVPGNLLPVPGHIPFGPPLAATLARHAITIDVLNPGFVHGYSHKPVLGFASGGFMLINRKQDFIDAFGDAGEAVSYASAQELRAKVDRFLTDDRYRREVGSEIRAIIAARFQLKDVLLRVLCATAAMAGPDPRPRRAEECVTTVADLLPELHSEPQWLNAKVEHADDGARLSTAPEAWAYAAAIRIPPLVSALHEPHLRVRIQVEAGRIGLAALLDHNGTLAAEQFIRSGAGALTVNVELPRQGATRVILRNAADQPSRALILEASLCDRGA